MKKKSVYAILSLVFFAIPGISYADVSITPNPIYLDQYPTVTVHYTPYGVDTHWAMYFPDGSFTQQYNDTDTTFSDTFSATVGATTTGTYHLVAFNFTDPSAYNLCVAGNLPPYTTTYSGCMTTTDAVSYSFDVFPTVPPPPFDAFSYLFSSFSSTSIATSTTSVIAEVDNSVQDLAYGFIFFYIVMGGTIWFFRRPRT